MTGPLGSTLLSLRGSLRRWLTWQSARRLSWRTSQGQLRCSSNYQMANNMLRCRGPERIPGELVRFLQCSACVHDPDGSARK